MHRVHFRNQWVGLWPNGTFNYNTNCVLVTYWYSLSFSFFKAMTILCSFLMHVWRISPLKKIGMPVQKKRVQVYVLVKSSSILDMHRLIHTNTHTHTHTSYINFKNNVRQGGTIHIIFANAIWKIAVWIYRVKATILPGRKHYSFLYIYSSILCPHYNPGDKEKQCV